MIPYHKDDLAEWLALRGYLHIALETTAIKAGGAGGAILDAWLMSGGTWLTAGSVDVTPPRPLALDFDHIIRGLTAREVRAPQVVLGADVLKPRQAVIDYSTSALFPSAQTGGSPGKP